MYFPHPATASASPEGSQAVKDAVRGALNVESTATGTTIRRLPGWTCAQYGEQSLFIDLASSQLSGVRLEFETDASWIELELTFRRISVEWAGVPTRPAVVSLAVEGHTPQDRFFDEGDIVQIGPDLTQETLPGARSVARFQLPPTAEARVVSLWLPHNCSAELHDVRADRELRPAATSRPRWIHYGSSISQASEADTPLGVWAVIAASQLGLDLLNLGLAGSAHLDQFVARTIRDEPASLITLKLGINVVNGATLRSRTFSPAVHGFLDTVRDGHPDTPIVVLTPIACPVHEDAPGPTSMEGGIARASDFPRTPGDGQLTLRDIRTSLWSIFEARSANDPNIHLLDGTLLFSAEDVQYLPDGLHPDATGLRLMGERFTALARDAEWLPCT